MKHLVETILKGNKMKKTIITFGSGQLYDFNVRPNDVALVIEANTETEARNMAFEFPGIGDKFCTSYPYETYIDEFILKYGMKEYTLSDLHKLRR